jgi:hypothetical protein
LALNPCSHQGTKTSRPRKKLARLGPELASTISMNRSGRCGKSYSVWLPERIWESARTGGL